LSDIFLLIALRVEGFKLLLELLLGALQLLYVLDIPLTHEVGLLPKLAADSGERHLLIVSTVHSAEVLLGVVPYLLDDAVYFLVIEVALSLQDLSLTGVLLGLRE
jgi:hypothetical protein